MNCKECVMCGISKDEDQFKIINIRATYFSKKCRQCRNKLMAEYRKTKLGKASLAKGFRKYAKSEKGKIAIKRARDKKTEEGKSSAHYAVWYAIKNGLLKRQPCQKCGNVKSEAHHKDYSKKLDVEWLCRTHHVEAHKLEDSYEL